MSRVFAVNGSPRKEKGNTARLLIPFLQGMQEAGASTEVAYASALDIRPCACGQLYCWNEKPGECLIKDDMQKLYPKLKTAEILVLATPVYVPLPGAMQNFLNRLVPLMNPVLRDRGGRTRVQLRADVAIRKIVLVVTSGWWEKENCDTVLRIVRELAEDASVEFTGALIRPHVSCMRVNGYLTPGGESVLDAAHQAGVELIQNGHFSRLTLETVSQPLVTFEDFLKYV